MSALLRVRGLSRRFGGVAAVDGVDLDLEAGVLTALVGPNGAGKTTLFNLITGHLRPDGGEIRLAAREITGLPPYRIARAGIARSFQDLRLFERMRVIDNLRTALEPAAWFWQRGGRRGRAAREVRVETVLAATGLAPFAAAEASALGYAERKFLALARIAVTEARIWLLDEPASGLDPASRRRFNALLREAVRERGVTICLIEHNLDIVSELADRIVFLDQGRKIAEGAPADILGDPALRALYFGAPA
jgi:branched-chain amino acid transport system ATP-binding protein